MAHPPPAATHGQALPPGTRLGEFELLRVLGEGGFGIVYLAKDHSLERTVALKEYMPSTLAMRSDGREVRVKAEALRETFDAGMRSFINEARLLARFDHPALVRVHRFWESHGTACLVMPYYEGRTLLQQQRTAPLSLDDASLRALALPLAEVLAVLHAEQVFHRDVAPDNVMLLAGSQRPLLLDFGAARRMIGDLTQSLTVILKPGYAPIEQYGELPDMRQGPWTDLYSLAALLDWAIGGAIPPASPLRVIEDHRRPLAQRAAGRFEPRVLAAIDRAMAVRPHERPQSVAEFLAEAGWSGSRGLLAPPATAAAADPVGGLAAMARLVAGWWPRRAEARDDGVSPAPQAPPAPSPAPAPPIAGHHGPAPRPGTGPDSPPPGMGPASLPTGTAGATGEAGLAADADAAADLGRTVIRRLPAVPPMPVAPAPATSPLAPDGDAPAGEGQRTVILEATPKHLALRLVVVASGRAPLVGRSLALQGTVFRIGRDPANDLHLPDPEATRHHAEIHRGSFGCMVLDLGSANGTFVNGRRLAPRVPERLLYGARITIGSTTLAFTVDAPEATVDLGGQCIAGRYRLGDCLRRSPRGAVYRATIEGSELEVVLKLLSAPATADPAHRAQFDREAAIARRLRHPHIVALQDHGVARLDGPGGPREAAFLCYGLLEGGTLAERLPQAPPVPQALAARWVVDIAAALQHAHDRGLVHGNLKPGALCLDGGDHVYVSDFAIGEAADPDGPLLGAPAYLAPEQWARQPATAASDQYSLAAIAYALLTGVPPFEGQEDPRVRERNFERGVEPADAQARRRGRPPVPAAAAALLQRALALDAAARHPRIEAFAMALAAALQGGGRLAATPPVFISYRRDTSAGWAVLVQRELRERHQIDTFVDTRATDAAAQFPERIAQAIGDCEVFVCLLAATTLDSPWVREEIRLAHAAGRPMIPVFQESFDRRADPGDDPALRRLLHYDAVHLFDLRNIHVEHSLADLARLVRGTIGRPGASG